jgi:hypothetical protein
MSNQPVSADPLPSDASTEDETSGRRPIKQMLAWAMGDREMEANALAEETAAKSGVTKEEALDAAKVAVADAHGDTGVSENDEPSSDVARPDDVVNEINELNAQ